MTKTYDAIIIGGGHNGLTSAAYFAMTPVSNRGGGGRREARVSKRPLVIPER